MLSKRGTNVFSLLILMLLFFSAKTAETAEPPTPNTEGKDADSQDKIGCPLRFHLDTEVATTSLGWVQLLKKYRQKNNEAIIIEGEDSTLTLISSDKVPGKSAEASGGYYIDYVKELENRIFIAQTAEYQVWYRAYFPASGSWSHCEQMDDNSPQNVQDSLNGPTKEWLWLKGPVYKLAKGWHTYLFPSPTAWCGGARLDKILIAPNNAPPPEGIGPAASTPVEMPQKAEFTSNRVSLDKGKNWVLDYEVEENGGAVKVEYSHDRGKTWVAAEKGKIYPVNPQTPFITFRFSFARGGQNVSPRIRHAVLTLYKS